MVICSHMAWLIPQLIPFIACQTNAEILDNQPRQGSWDPVVCKHSHVSCASAKAGFEHRGRGPKSCRKKAHTISAVLCAVVCVRVVWALLVGTYQRVQLPNADVVSMLEASTNSGFCTFPRFDDRLAHLVLQVLTTLVATTVAIDWCPCPFVLPMA